MRFLTPTILLLSTLASDAGAVPAVRYTWGPASGLQISQSFVTTTTYSQTLSATGLSGTISGLEVLILTGPALAWAGAAWVPVPAWKALIPYGPADGDPGSGPPLPAPRPDCAGATGWSVSSAVAGADPIPGSALAATAWSGPISVTRPEWGSRIQVSVAIDPPFVADPTRRYAIATLEFHHQNSVGGSGGPGCWGADQPRCFAVLAAWAFGGGPAVYVVAENALLRWNADELDEASCYRMATPARASSWGRLKTIYR